MLNWVLSAVLVAGCTASGTWKAPERPDPSRILEEAAEDTVLGRCHVALAKHLWFHENALKYDPALAGVRLSYALSGWVLLAQVYPPALEALKKTRDDALEAVKRAQGTDDVFNPFYDLASINRQLGEVPLTARAFAELDRDRPSAAKRVFRAAQGSLIAAKEYGLCGKYLSPEEDWSLAARVYQGSQRHYEGSDPHRAELAGQFFTHEVTSLLALLVVNGRKEEAEKIAQKARREWDDAAFHTAIDAALRGQMPDPWP